LFPRKKLPENKQTQYFGMGQCPALRPGEAPLWG
jgi:hypothetical protein